MYSDNEWIQIFEKMPQLPLESDFWPRIRLLTYSFEDRKLLAFEEEGRILRLTHTDPETLILICRIVQSVNGGHRFQVWKHFESSRTVVIVREDVGDEKRKELLQRQQTQDGNFGETVM